MWLDFLNSLVFQYVSDTLFQLKVFKQIVPLSVLINSLSPTTKARKHEEKNTGLANDAHILDKLMTDFSLQLV